MLLFIFDFYYISFIIIIIFFLSLKFFFFFFFLLHIFFSLLPGFNNIKYTGREYFIINNKIYNKLREYYEKKKKIIRLFFLYITPRTYIYLFFRRSATGKIIILIMIDDNLD